MILYIISWFVHISDQENICSHTSNATFNLKWQQSSKTGSRPFALLYFFIYKKNLNIIFSKSSSICRHGNPEVESSRTIKHKSVAKKKKRSWKEELGSNTRGEVGCKAACRSQQLRAAWRYLKSQPHMKLTKQSTAHHQLVWRDYGWARLWGLPKLTPCSDVIFWLNDLPTILFFNLFLGLENVWKQCHFFSQFHFSNVPDMSN